MNAKIKVLLAELIIGGDMDFAQRIKMLCMIRNIKLKDLAAELGMSSSTLTYRLNTGKFSIEENKRVSEICDVKYIYTLNFDDGYVITGDTHGDMFREALEHVGMTLTELAKKMGVTRQAISKKLKISKFSDRELEKYSKAVGCSHKEYYELEDGTRI